MKYTLRSLCFFTLMLLLGTKNSIAQNNNLDIHFQGYGFFDNREYRAFEDRSHTFSGARAEVDLGRMEYMNLAQVRFLEKLIR
ncbi:MAG: hypothetical protein ACRYGB_10595 [Janthinobacterium lividum]